MRGKKCEKYSCKHQVHRRIWRWCSRTTVEQVFPCSLWRGPHQSRCPHCSPWRTLHWRRWVFPRGLCSVTNIHAGPAKKEERVAKTSCYRMTATPIPHSPAPWGLGVEEDRGVRYERVRLSLERRERLEGGCLGFFFFASHYPTLL